MGWGADYPDPDNFMNLFTSYSGNNNTKWQNPIYDKLIQKGAVTRDPAVRQKIYDKAQKILLEEDVAIMPLFQESIALLISKRTRPWLNAMNVLYLKHWEMDG